MKIYGVALLCGCFLFGKFTGRMLGKSIGIDGDIGGVGFAMILLMFLSSYLRKKDWLKNETESGIWFWSSMYIPIIIAMAASQNVKAAFSGGWVAILAGLAATLVGYFLIPVISRIGKQESKDPDSWKS